MRVRCMKFKRKLSYDNYRMRQGTFDKKPGLLTMLDFTQLPWESRRRDSSHTRADPPRWKLATRGNETGVARCGKAARR